MTAPTRHPNPDVNPTAILDADPGRPHALNRTWCDAFNAGDLEALLATYEEDAVIVPGPGAEPLRGHPAIRAALQQFLALGGTLDYTPSYWIVEGDLVLSSIRFRMTGGHDAEGNPVPLAGTTTEVLRRQPDGTVKYVIDHPFGGS